MTQVLSCARRIATVIAFLLPTALYAQPFEGAITMRMASAAGSSAPPMELVYMSRGGKVRVSVPTPAGQVLLLSVPAEDKAWLVMDAQRSYMELESPPSDGKPATAAAVRVVRTGKRDTVAGYPCEHVRMEWRSESRSTSGEMTTQRMDICQSSALGPFVFPSAGMPGVSGRRAAPWQQELANTGAFPLVVAEADGTVLMEVTRVEKRRVRDALFRIPLDYRKMDLPKR